jgi:hypothetical protein
MTANSQLPWREDCDADARAASQQNLVGRVASRVRKPSHHGGVERRWDLEAPEALAMANIKRVSVIGAGQMGSGIAHVCALAGYDVLLNDLVRARIDESLTVIDRNMSRQVARGIVGRSTSARPSRASPPPRTSPRPARSTW